MKWPHRLIHSFAKRPLRCNARWFGYLPIPGFHPLILIFQHPLTPSLLDPRPSELECSVDRRVHPQSRDTWPLWECVHLASSGLALSDGDICARTSPLPGNQSWSHPAGIENREGKYWKCCYWWTAWLKFFATWKTYLTGTWLPWITIYASRLPIFLPVLM